MVRPSGLLHAAGRVLVLNAGSSSLKFKTFDAATLAPEAWGLAERIGEASKSALKVKYQPTSAHAGATPAGAAPEAHSEAVPLPDHAAALDRILAFLRGRVSRDLHVTAVGHRIVHGLDISAASLLTESVLGKIRKAVALAPLHNPPGLQGVEAAVRIFGSSVPQVGIFDTAFHQTLPPHAFMYALPYDCYSQQHIRRYGFHGTNHRYVAEAASRLLGKPLSQTNVITCHLGNGSSITAVKGGCSIDTSMGMTPLEGLVMGTRCGDLDPAVVLHLQSSRGLSVQETDTLLNKQSGLKGVCGQSDVRAVLAARAAGDDRAALALDMFTYRIRKYIGAYTAAMGGSVDAIVFSAGIGENSAIVRSEVCAGLEAMGIALDPAKNAATVDGASGDIAASGSKVRVLVIPADEELAIAQQTLEALNNHVA